MHHRYLIGATVFFFCHITPLIGQENDALLSQEKNDVRQELLTDIEQYTGGNLLLEDDGAGHDLLLGEEPEEGNDLLLSNDDVDQDDLLVTNEIIDRDETSPPGDDEAINAGEAHLALFTESRFPSATTCATCHPDQYKEWAVSSHAYAQISPVFNTMQATVVKLTNGTNGDFCIRCHSPIGMQLEEPIFTNNINRLAASREGITCIVCHRIKNNYGKISGRISLEEGDVFAPVYGPSGNEILKEIIANKDKYKVNTDPEKSGRNIHTDSIEFAYIGESGFCGMCHDVNLLNGFRLEDAFSQFKNTAAAKRGETCQDCHMATIPGKVSPYAIGPAAIVGGKPTPDRKRTNHMMAGPDYSIVNPGIFPHNTRAQELANIDQWLSFNYEAGWGTDTFEDTVPPDYVFPKHWKYIDDRYEAREVLEVQFAELELIRIQRYQILRRGFQLGDFVVDENDENGLAFRIKLVNGTDGHSVPVGFDAERLQFLQITVTDVDGKVILESGNRDPNGDLLDPHSSYVHNGELKRDKQLFSLQSKFLVRNNRGGESEQILPINFSISPLPFIRPEARPTILQARPSSARKQNRAIPPSGYRWAKYTINKSALSGRLPYKVNIKFISQMVPVNLIGAIQSLGFDYGMSARLVADRIVAQSDLLWEKNVVFESAGQVIDFTPTETEIMAPPPYPLKFVAPRSLSTQQKARIHQELKEGEEQ